MYSDELKQKIDSQSVSVGIVGMGYVGLPLALAFCDVGISVVGFDVDESKCVQINTGESYIKHLPSHLFETHVEAKRLDATHDFSRLGEVDVIIICVPTPIDQHNVPDLKYIRATVQNILQYGVQGQLIVLESSTYPGTTREELTSLLLEEGKQDGEHVFVAFSPEREDPSNPNFTTRSIPKTVGADHDISRELACQLYDKIIDQVVPVSSTAVAEASKLTENIFRAVNIAMVNELKVIYSQMGIDVWEVIEAASTKPFGYMPFYPGPGLGGHCIPIDPFYLTWKAKEYGLSTRFIELAGEINTAMPAYVVDQLTKALSQKFEKSLFNSSILLVGLAYKSNVDDDRESPAYKLMALLNAQGAHVDYSDVHIPSIKKTRKYPQYENLKSVDLTPDTIGQYDAVVIVTAHDDVDYAMLVKHARLILDTRNVLSEFSGDHILKA